ncbi:MAG TPA: transposase [Ktedonobacterales bacterium]|nr:transposase [Ktedonobacterales bacterium]
MDIKRSVTILLPDDSDLRATVAAFQRVQQTLTEPCYNDGKPLSAIALHHAMYAQVVGTLNSQMTCSAIRLTAGAYASAKANRHVIEMSFAFRHARALFLVGKRGRDADLRPDGTLSIWTVAGRKHITYTVPEAFKTTLANAKEIDSLTVIERNGRLLGRVTLTLAVPEPMGVHPVGVDLNETNTLVAVDPDGKTLFVSGRAVKVANKRNYKTRKRVQQKHAAHKAAHRDTRSVRRVLKQLGRKRSNRTRTFAQIAAKQLLTFAPANAVLVFEALTVPQPRRGRGGGKAPRRRLSVWQRQLIRHAAESRAQEAGMVVAEVNPAYTSQICSRCGLRGVRQRHTFSCPNCGHSAHADVNAAVNIRNRYTVLRDGGLQVS